MEITKQKSSLECGVCVINSFVKHYYNQNIKHEILDSANITDNGLSIYDFELLGQKYNLLIESFHCKDEELLDLNKNKYYVTIFNENNLFHYVFFKKQNNSFKIYDSAKGEYYLTKEQFIKKYINIIITIDKIKTKVNFTSNNLTIKPTNFKFILVNLLLNFSSIILSTLLANVVSWSLSFAVNIESIKNLITILFLFVLINLLEHLINYLLSNYLLMYFRQSFNILTNKFIEIIKNKKCDFFNKYERNNLYLIESAILTITNYYIKVIPSFISNIIMIVCLTVILLFINYFFLFFVLFYLVVTCLTNFFTYRISERNFKLIIQYTSETTSSTSELIENILNKLYPSQKMKNIEKLKNNFFNFKTTYIKNQADTNHVLFWDYFLKELCYLFSVFIGCVLIMNNKLNVYNLFLIFALLHNCMSLMSELFSFFAKKNEYSKMVEIYLGVLKLSNIKNNEDQLQINEKINSLTFKNEQCEQKILVGDTLSDKLNINDLSKINDLSITHNQKIINENVYLLDWNVRIMKEDVINVIKHADSQIINMINFFNLNIHDKLNQKSNFVYNLFYFSTLKNKIIMLDQSIKLFNEKEKKEINKFITNRIANKNFLFFIN